MPDVIAHRGASGLAPEHTVAAYDLAVALGADRLEVDVRPLADGTPVVVHDRTLERTCGDPRLVGQLMPADLERLDPATRPLLLADVLDRYDTRLLVELKEPGPGDADGVLRCLDRAGARPRTAIQSFHHGPLERLAAAEPDLELVALYRRRTPAAWIRWDLRRVAGWAGGVTVPRGAVDDGYVRDAHVLGLHVAAYTVNDAAGARRLTGLGVDGLITDLPHVVRDELAVPLAA